MLSARGSTINSDDSFITCASSVADLMATSQTKIIDSEFSDTTCDILTGVEFDSICDVTMKELHLSDDKTFIDSTNLDYLIKCTESSKNNNIDRSKESLFVKFDPLYAKQVLVQSNTGTHCESITSTTECDVGYETGSAVSDFADSYVAIPKHSMSMGCIQMKSGKDKPTQVVPPVVNPEVAGQTKSTPALVRSASAILTPTQVATERLISISGNTPPVAAPRTPVRHTSFNSQEENRLHSLRLILQKQDNEVLQQRRENRELKSSLQDVEHKYSRIVENLEAKVKKLTDDKTHYLDTENKLLQEISEKALSNKKMSIVMEEYEKTISMLIGDLQQEKIKSQEALDKLKSEKEQALLHLSNMECSFNDLLMKYEKCKNVIIEAKEREKVYEEKIAEYDTSLKKYDSEYENLKRITSEALDNANLTLDNIKKNHNVEIAKLNATIKKNEVTISSLQDSIAQKTRENEELTRICDQLINDVH